MMFHCTGFKPYLFGGKLTEFACTLFFTTATILLALK